MSGSSGSKSCAFCGLPGGSIHVTLNLGSEIVWTLPSADAFADDFFNDDFPAVDVLWLGLAAGLADRATGCSDCCAACCAAGGARGRSSTDFGFDSVLSVLLRWLACRHGGKPLGGTGLPLRFRSSSS